MTAQDPVESATPDVDDGENGKGVEISTSLVGSVLGERFRVLERIAAGGMGVVYLAEQMPLGRKVAVKVLTPPAGTSETEAKQFRERFLLEAASSAQLSHPNTVIVHDFGAVDDLCYIVMEYISGRTLMRELRTSGPMPVARALPIALQIAVALQDAHEARMVHRDLKPGNIMLTRRGATEDFVKVLDFGLVKPVDDDERNLTHHNVILGSPRYMAPEQVQSGKIDARTDIYSFGTVLYQMLTGSPPFNTGTRIQILVAHVRETPAPFAAKCQQCDVPARVEALVMKCLAKNPDDRPQSMKEIAAELLACMSDIGLSTSNMTMGGSGIIPSGMARDTSSGSMSKPNLVDTSSVVSATLSSTDKDDSSAVAREPSPVARKSPTVAIVGAIGALALVGGLVFASMRTRGDGASANGAHSTASAPALTRVSLITEPAGAHVHRDGRDLGDTPVSLAIPQGEQWNVELTRAGYASRVVHVTGGQNEARVQLEQLDSGAATAATTAGATGAANGAQGAQQEAADASNAARAQRNAGYRPRAVTIPSTGARPEVQPARTSENRDPWAQ
ncbi:MAG: serine/threonine-protein kinase [Polyangiales bacterium]